jgi:hypothetical protein
MQTIPSRNSTNPETTTARETTTEPTIQLRTRCLFWLRWFLLGFSAREAVIDEVASDVAGELLFLDPTVVLLFSVRT